MRGEAHAHLVEADDGCAYVVKVANNPQGGRRLLVNEFIGSALLAHLGIATPRRAFVSIDEGCMSGTGLPTGLHFGSRYPGIPDTIAVYDFLPDALLHKVQNRDDFFGALVFDRWVSNVDARQAIFFRHAIDPGDASNKVGSFVAQMIDNGSVLAGPDWVLRKSAMHGIYPRRAVYGPEVTMKVFEPWLQVLVKLGSNLLGDILDEIPTEWIRGDEQRLERLLARLYQRRMLVPAMIEGTVEFLQVSRARSRRRIEVWPRSRVLTTALMPAQRANRHPSRRGPLPCGV
jgi:hypothetical protein